MEANQDGCVTGNPCFRDLLQLLDAELFQGALGTGKPLVIGDRALHRIEAIYDPQDDSRMEKEAASMDSYLQSGHDHAMVYPSQNFWGHGEEAGIKFKILHGLKKRFMPLPGRHLGDTCHLRAWALPSNHPTNFGEGVCFTTSFRHAVTRMEPTVFDMGGDSLSLILAHILVADVYPVTEGDGWHCIDAGQDTNYALIQGSDDGSDELVATQESRIQPRLRVVFKRIQRLTGILLQDLPYLYSLLCNSGPQGVAGEHLGVELISRLLESAELTLTLTLTLIGGYSNQRS